MRIRLSSICSRVVVPGLDGSTSALADALNGLPADAAAGEDDTVVFATVVAAL